MANQEYLERFQEGVIVSPEEAGAEVRRLLEDHLPSRSFFESYRPLRHWFLRPDESGNIHGISHEARVLIWQEILARLLIKEGVSLDQEALRWAAVTHDTQRQEDGADFPMEREPQPGCNGSFSIISLHLLCRGSCISIPGMSLPIVGHQP